MFQKLKNLDRNNEQKLVQETTILDCKRKCCHNTTTKASQNKYTDSKCLVNRQFFHHRKKNLQQGKHRSRRGRCSMRKGVLKVFAKFKGIHLCRSHSFNKCKFLKKEIPMQLFSCEFCEIFKNTFFIENLQATASENTRYLRGLPMH